ncbi:MAG TPA: hypothetical protein VL197_02170 [Nitrospirota bacterium]|nr:hypothetical protein [Nitrospirota bacterium]
MNVIVTWMYSSPEGESICHSQVGSASGTQRVQNIYWRCVFLLFESSARLNPGARHILFINKRPPNEIDGVEINRLVQQYKIEFIEFTTITKSPSDYYGEWNTQFMVLDVLDRLKEVVRDDDKIFILDSDIIFNKSIDDDLLRALDKHKALLYSIDYDDKHNINGLTRLELIEVAKHMDVGFPAKEFTYSGGEFICCLGSELSRIADAGRRNYLVSLERHKKKQKKFNEEAHLLSYVYHLLGYQTHTANRFIKRIWTDRSIYSTIDGSESELVFWHLPVEKKRGFVNVFRSYRKIDGEYRLTIKNFARAYRIEEAYPSKIPRYIKQAVRPVYQILKSMTPQVMK